MHKSNPYSRRFPLCPVCGVRMRYGVVSDVYRVQGYYCVSVFCTEFHPAQEPVEVDPAAIRSVTVWGKPSIPSFSDALAACWNGFKSGVSLGLLRREKGQ